MVFHGRQKWQPKISFHRHFKGFLKHFSNLYLSEVKHKNCSKLEIRMKFGTRMHLGMENSN